MFNGADLRSIFLLVPDAQNNDRLVEQNITRDVGPGDPVADFFRRPDVRRLAHAPLSPLQCFVEKCSDYSIVRLRRLISRN